MLDYESEEDIDCVEFDFSIPLDHRTTNLTERHDEIAHLLGLTSDDNDEDTDEEDSLPLLLFKTIAALCDPFTQPEESNECILSVDCISDLIIAILYKSYVQKHESAKDMLIESIRFDISTILFGILREIHKLLNANDELHLRYINNDEAHYMENLPKWTPIPIIAQNEYTLRLVYSIACVIILAMYKLFIPKTGDYNLTSNPYLHYFLKLWKCHTNIILLGLEIDRRLEFLNHEKGTHEETPMIVEDTLKGSSSIRYVLAWILNQNPSSTGIEHEDEDQDTLKDSSNGDKLQNPIDYGIDLRNETVFNFVQPLARKNTNGGAILLDMRLVSIALLILYSGTSFTAGVYQIDDNPSVNEDQAGRRLNQSKPISEIGDILIDLEYADRFDEDIKYMLEYDYDEDDDDDDDDEENENGNEDEYDNGEASTKSISNPKGKLDKNDLPSEVGEALTASGIEFDEFGRDWRDIPRGENREFNNLFTTRCKQFDKLTDKSDSDDFFVTWDELYETFEFLVTNSIEGNSQAESRIGQVVINTIAKAIKDNLAETESAITPSKIYKYWTSLASVESIKITQDENNKMIVPIFNVTKFELFLHNNSQVARAAMDEMLMCEGYRRLLIWFVTHNLNISILLIDYVYQLLAGLRGTKEIAAPYAFSRKGDKLLLSDIEQLMLLHEFLTNSNVYLSATNGIEIEGGYQVVLAE